MHINHLYYSIKHLIPRRMQLLLRRKVIERKLRHTGNVWPIHEASKKAPDGWQGWPEQKKFALVLTHDVDTAIGAAKSERLMEMEFQLGFRSSFNFVPERYHLPAAIRHTLTTHGFEVGVHGLTHDGMLYRSREIFSGKARRINQYLKEWRAVGFRSPAMHHRLDWIHELDIEYDASTFDTDPFEPQSDGAGTIFPFWVANGTPQDVTDHGASFRSSALPANCKRLQGAADARKRPASYSPLGEQADDKADAVSCNRLPQDGYVELPYTMPQDFTLFVLMRHENIEIWQRKLDWIAAHGGMALMNVHPDYINFDNKRGGVEEYPARFYRQCLEYVKKKYEGKYWHALPREMARYVSTKGGHRNALP